MSHESSSATSSQGSRIGEIASLFVKMGVMAFGGPAAHIAMLHKEVVDRRKWLTDDHFMDLVGATSLIPGPNSTEMVMHTGHQRGGVAGLFTAGAAFVLPACILTGILAYLYSLGEKLPLFTDFLIGIKPVVMILIYQAVRKLWGKAIKSTELAIVAGAVCLMALSGLSEVVALALGGLGGYIAHKLMAKPDKAQVAVAGVFWVFLKIGCVLFGSGYVLIAYLQDEVVNQRGWLTTGQIADAIAFGQFTPGPVLSSATFVGYQLAALPGAVVATLGIFLPSFFFVWLLNPLVPKMRKSKDFGLILDCVNAGALGLMAYALIPLGQVSLSHWVGIVVGILGVALVYFKPKINAMILVALGMGLGAALMAVDRNLL